MRCFWGVTLVFVLASTTYATPDKRAALAFVREMNGAMKLNKSKLQSQNNQAISEHSRRIQRIKQNGTALFAPADACHFAANSALQLWTNQLLQNQKPSSNGKKVLNNAAKDYKENLSLCIQYINKLR